MRYWTGRHSARIVGDMGKTDALARVAADLARGHTHPAIQRLSSLVTVHPTDLDLRRRLAAVYRMVGNRIEAGRWAYLDPAADPAETAAFERAFPTPAGRLAALRWPDLAGLAATEYARRRLQTLARAADGHLPAGGRRLPRTRSRSLGVAVVAAVAFLVTAFAVLGLVTLAQWLL